MRAPTMTEEEIDAYFNSLGQYLVNWDVNPPPEFNPKVPYLEVMGWLLTPYDILNKMTDKDLPNEYPHDLKRFKEEVSEVKSGFECGVMLDNYSDIKVGDIIETFEEVSTSRKL